MRVSRDASFASLVLILFGTVIVPTPARIFWGEIMDSLCAQVGGHETPSRSLATERQCTIGCVQAGAKFVLYNPRVRQTFQLDDQLKPRQYAGERVMVLGVYNRTTNTIHVVEIQPVYIDAVVARATFLVVKMHGR
jgi:hypothetical protein